MHHLYVIPLNRVYLIRSFVPICTQVRWKVNYKRKPTWLPVAPSKLFNIPKHPHVPKDERQLTDDLLDEYYTKLESLRKLIQEELKLNPANDKKVLEIQRKKEEEEFKLLLEENAKENERIRVIREATVEKEFQEKQLEFLQMAEEKKKTLEETKLKIEEIVRKEKEKSKGYITRENLDAVIEEAIDNPVNLNFCISLNGSVTWEGKPPPEYEDEIENRISKAKIELQS